MVQQIEADMGFLLTRLGKLPSAVVLGGPQVKRNENDNNYDVLEL